MAASLPRRRTALCILALLIPSSVFAAEPAFKDVATDSLYSLSVSFLKNAELIAGYDDGTFRPEQAITRAEALAMILKATRPEVLEKVADDSAARKKLRLGKSDVREASVERPFDDVLPTAWFFDVVSEGKELGVIKGRGDGTRFEPHRKINLAEALRMLFVSGKDTIDPSIMLNAKLPTDVDATAWYAPDIAYALSRTMLYPTTIGYVMPPDHEMTRGELAHLIYKYLRTRGEMRFGFASWYGDGLSKRKINNGVEYAEKYLTAAHRTLPMGTIIRVTNMKTGASVEVVVNDSGPYVQGRIVDLSKTAFSQLASPGTGIIHIQLEPLID